MYIKCHNGVSEIGALQTFLCALCNNQVAVFREIRER